MPHNKYARYHESRNQAPPDFLFHEAIAELFVRYCIWKFVWYSPLSLATFLIFPKSQSQFLLNHFLDREPIVYGTAHTCSLCTERAEASFAALTLGRRTFTSTGMLLTGWLWSRCIAVT